MIALASIGMAMNADQALAECAGTFLLTNSIENCLDPPPPVSDHQRGGAPRDWLVRNLVVEQKDHPAESEAAVNLWVNFGFGSADLTTDTRITLDELAKALLGPRLADKKFVVVGHTDAVGTVEYNQSLSERRANAVRTYLVSQRQVPSDRIIAEGLGFSRPLNEQNPRAAENRRVEVRTAQ